MGKLFHQLTQFLLRYINHKDTLILIGCIAVTVALTLAGNITATDQSELVLKSIDEDAFQRVIHRIHIGIDEFNVNEILVGAFLSYGWTFFATNALITYIPHLLGQEELIVILPRLFSAISGGVGVFMVYKIAALQLKRYQALLAASLLFTMPAFYINAFWMHPEHPVVAPLLIALYWFIKDDSKYGKFYIFGLIWIGVSLSIKLTGLVFFIVPLLYVLHGIVQRLRPLRVKSWILPTALLGLVPLASLIVFNPTVLIPGRAQAIIKNLQRSTLDNKTNHGGITEDITIWRKLTEVIATDYVALIILALLLALFIYGMVHEFRKQHTSLITLLSGSWVIIFLLYNLTQVVKLWQHYYLPALLFLPLAFCALWYIKWLQPYITHIIIGTVIISFGLQLGGIIEVFAESSDAYVNSDYNTEVDTLFELEGAEVATTAIQANSIEITSVLTSPYLPFPSDEFNLSYGEHYRIYGQLSEKMLNGFNYPDIVILSKNDLVFSDLSSDNLKQRSDYSDIVAGQEYINVLRSGDHAIYDVLLDHDTIVLLNKKP